MPDTPGPGGGTGLASRGVGTRAVGTALAATALLALGAIGAFAGVSWLLRGDVPQPNDTGADAASAREEQLASLGIDPGDVADLPDAAAEDAAVRALLDEPPDGVYPLLALTCDTVQPRDTSAIAIDADTLLAPLPEDTVSVAVRTVDGWRTARPTARGSDGMTLLTADRAPALVASPPTGLVPRPGQQVAVQDGNGRATSGTVLSPRETSGAYTLATDGEIADGALARLPNGDVLGIVRLRDGLREVVTGTQLPRGPAETAANPCSSQVLAPESTVPVTIAVASNDDVLQDGLVLLATGLNQRAETVDGLLADADLARRLRAAFADTAIWAVEVEWIGEPGGPLPDTLLTPGGDPDGEPDGSDDDIEPGAREGDVRRNLETDERLVGLRYLEVDRDGCWWSSDQLAVRAGGAPLTITRWQPDRRVRTAC